jgi:tRNA U38,U39,U40 pseudouridine synthase TruA
MCYVYVQGCSNYSAFRARALETHRIFHARVGDNAGFIQVALQAHSFLNREIRVAAPDVI